MLRFIWLSALEFFIQLLGLVVNVVGILFRRLEDDTSNAGEPRPYEHYPQHGVWERWRFPKWLLWWDNPYDGLKGDKRGWWADECRKHGRTEHDFLSMYIWSALRNPANYFSRKVTGCDVSDCVIEKVAGDNTVDDTGKSGKSWQYLKAVDSEGREYIRLYGVIPYGSRMVYFNLGWKIKLEHNGTSEDEREQDRFKGNTLRFNPFRKVEA